MGRMHVAYDSWFSWRHESSLRFGIGSPRLFVKVAATMISKHFVNLGIIIYRKCEVKMACILFKFIIHPSYERALKHGLVKSTRFTKSSLNLSFGQGSYVISDFAQPNSVKAVLLQVSLRSDIIIFNNNFVFFQAGFLKPFMSSFCSMP